jgi:hypothetical protein
VYDQDLLKMNDDKIFHKIYWRCMIDLLKINDKDFPQDLLYVYDQDLLYDEWWKMKDERWMMKERFIVWWMMKDERWKMKYERWKMYDEWKIYCM